MLCLGRRHRRKIPPSLEWNPHPIASADPVPATTASDIELDGLGVREQIQLRLAKLCVVAAEAKAHA
jgi:hypothetical protein